MSRGIPSFYVIVGAPGSGKSSQIAAELAATASPRRMIFDIEGEFSKAGRVCGLEDARLALIAAGERGPFSLVYQPRTDDPDELRARFGAFCKLAFAAERLQFVVDELADVDSPNPYLVVPAWSMVLRKGRKRGLQVIAGTQRPADVNSRLWSFCTRLRAGWLAKEGDERTLARALRVEEGELAALTPGQWIERDRFTGATTRGTIAWRGGRPVNELRAPGAERALELLELQRQAAKKPAKRAKRP